MHPDDKSFASRRGFLFFSVFFLIDQAIDWVLNP
jgi:hypothetical protein